MKMGFSFFLTLILFNAFGLAWSTSIHNSSLHTLKLILQCRKMSHNLWQNEINIGDNIIALCFHINKAKYLIKLIFETFSIKITLHKYSNGQTYR